jgi:hypothetical protein
MSCYSCDYDGYRNLCSYNVGDKCNTGTVCPSNQIPQLCPDGKTIVCSTDGNWRSQCPKLRPCPLGQNLYQCPNGLTICDFPGTNWMSKCCPSDQQYHVCPDGKTMVCAKEGTNWGSQCPQLCPKGQNMYTCPNNNKNVCAYPGTNWTELCTVSPSGPPMHFVDNYLFGVL